MREFLLMIGDDGALLVPPKGMRKAAPVIVGSDEDADFTVFFDLLKRAPRTPVRVLCDCRTQTVRRAELPPLSFFDRQKLLDRRLAQTFPDTHLRVALTGPNKTYLFAALEETAFLTLWRERLMKAGNPWHGFALSSIELAGLGPRLVPQTARGWALLLLAHQTGGFRQIIMKDGRAVFTRLTPTLPPTMNVENVAESLAADIRATRLYLGRLGLSGNDALPVVAVLPSSLKEPFALTVGMSCSAFTPTEAAKRIKIDALFAIEAWADHFSLLWAGKMASWPSLLARPEDKAECRTNFLHRFGVALATVTFGLVLGHIGLMTIDGLARYERMRVLGREVTHVRSTFENLQAKAATTARSLARLRSAVEKRRFFTKKELEPWTVAQNAAVALTGVARARSLTFKDDVLTLEVLLLPDAKTSNLETRAQIIARFEAANALLQNALPSYDVALLSLPFPAMPQETLTNKKETKVDPAARFSITRRNP